jgi:hypothetical protein
MFPSDDAVRNMMFPQLARFTDVALLLLRIIILKALGEWNRHFASEALSVLHVKFSNVLTRNR